MATAIRWTWRTHALCRDIAARQQHPITPIDLPNTPIYQCRGRVAYVMRTKAMTAKDAKARHNEPCKRKMMLRCRKSLAVNYGGQAKGGRPWKSFDSCC